MIFSNLSCSPAIITPKHFGSCVFNDVLIHDIFRFPKKFFIDLSDINQMRQLTIGYFHSATEFVEENIWPNFPFNK